MTFRSSLLMGLIACDPAVVVDWDIGGCRSSLRPLFRPDYLQFTLL